VQRHAKPFEAGFAFEIGEQKIEKIIWVRVEKQLKSKGLHCQSKLVEPGSIQAETCNL
jgi:hypothetical protein